ncbi:class I SAM-dependent methyltransferase [Sulfurimonas sp.]|uniref:class I SAM-dependent methyltransferase n=1 Tax=Sulfurimonas sp. TaxID=2022749 RepID=UPI003568586F
MYDKKEKIYFHNVRKELLDLIPEENKNGHVLEIGAGEGNTLVYAKENGLANHIYGVELCKIENSNQTSELFSDFIIGNIENIDLPFEELKFDVIICGDVLEHLVDPYEVIDKLKKHLKDDGVIIASIPNIREWRTMKTILIKGDFKYSDEGILDKTHLRFFTKKNILELFENKDFNINKIISSNKDDALKYLKKLRPLKFLSRFFFEELFTIQYYVVASKKKPNNKH